MAEPYNLPPGADPLAAAVGELSAGPRRPGLGPGLPAGVRVRSVRATGNVVELDLSQDFAQAYPSGGSAAEIALLAPIVYTLTAIDGVEAVRISVEGRAPDLPGASFDLSRPLARSDLPSDLVRISS